MKIWKNAVSSRINILWVMLIMQPCYVRAAPIFTSQFGTPGSGNGQFSGPTGIAANAAGQIYVADLGNDRIQIFDGNNTFLSTFGSTGNGNGQFSAPVGITISTAGNLYVTDRGNNRIQIFDPNNTFLSTFGSFGTGNGQFFSPEDVTTNAAGQVYVADTGNDRIQTFTSSGVFLSTFSIPQPVGVVINNSPAGPFSGRLYGVEPFANKVGMFNSTAPFASQGTFGSLGNGPGQFNKPFGISLAPSSGNVYVADTNNNRVQIFTPAGNFLNTFGDFGNQPNQFSPIEVLVQNTTGKIYVVDFGHRNVQVFFDPTVWTQAGTSNLLSLPLNQNLTLNPGFNLHVNNVNGGTGNTSLLAGANLTLNGGNFRTVSMNIVSGSITDQANSTLTVPLSISAATFNSVAGNTFTYAGNIGNISGPPGALTKTGAGNLVLTGTNTYSGGTFLNGGTLAVGADANLGSAAGPLTFNTGTLESTRSFTSGRNITINATAGTFQIDGVTNTTTLYGNITGGGALAKTGAGNLTLTGTNTYSGGTTISGGTLTGNTTSLKGNILNNAALVFNQAANGTFGGNISGTGAFRKANAGNLTLTGTNTYSGGTTISGGTLTGNTTSLKGNILNNAALIFNQAANGTFGGNISGTGAFRKANAGNLTLTGTNTYSGGTTISGGTLTGNTTSIKGSILNNGTLVFDQAVNSTFGGNISGTGSFTKLNAGNLTLTGTNTYRGGTTISGGTLAGNTTSLKGNILNNAALIFNQAANGTFGGVISGNGSVGKTNGGTLILTGTNTYSGGTFLNGGTLAVGADASLGSTAGPLTFNTGTLESTRSFTSGRNITINATAGTFQIDGVTNRTTLNGNITGGGALAKMGAGNLTLTGTNTYSGGTFLNGGTLAVGADANLGSTAGPLTFNTGTLESTRSFTSGRNITINATGGTFGGTFQVDGVTNTTTLNGNITGGGALAKTGAGNLTLTGINTYTGGTTITAGTLKGNTTSIKGSILNNGTLVFDQAANSTFGGNISGTGSFTKLNAGNLTLTGTNTYSGGTTITAGTLTGNTTSLKGNILNNAALVFNQTANGTFGGNVSGGGTLTKTGAGTATMRGNYSGFTGLTTIVQGELSFTASAPASINIPNPSARVGFSPPTNTTLSYGGSISGVGAVLVNGPGIVFFTGVNTYTGNTIVNQGTFALNSALPNSPVSVNSPATLKGKGLIQSLNLSGTISPGNSTIGTLTITNNFTMTPSSTYKAEVSGNGASDLVGVGKRAQLNGTLDVVTVGSRQTLKNKTFTILTGAQGVAGKFANLVSGNRVKYTVKYLPTSVQVAINALQEFTELFNSSDTSNAARTARYLDTFADNPPAGSDLSGVVSVLDGFLNAGNTAGLTSALNQIQPSLFREFGFLSSAQATLVNKTVRMQQQYRREGVWDKTLVLECICPTRLASFQHLVGNQPMKGFLSQNSFSSGTAKPKRKGLLGFQDEGNIKGAPLAQRVRNELTSMWIEPYGQVNRKSHNSHGGTRNGNGGVKSHTSGFSLGGDAQLCKNTFVGLLGGYSNTPFDWKSRRGNGHMNTTNLGIYGTWMDDSGLYVDGQVIGGNNRFKSWRKIAFGSINRTAHESHRALQLSTDGEIGYAMALPCFTVQPFLNLDYILVHENSYKERGAQSFNLNIKSKTAQFLQGELGATIYHTYVVNETLIRPAIQLGWVQKRPFEHNGHVKGGLVGQPQTLIVVGDNRTRNQFAPAVSLTAQLPNGINLIANLSAEVFDGQNTGEALLKLGYDF
jgi:outer membrane autotransporter protein